jgi:signal transduction histidine kinase
MNENKAQITTVKPNLFNQMKIGLRVGLSFLVILAIFIATSVFNLNIFSQSETSFSYYSKASSDSIAIFDLDRQESELQQIILIYSNTGNKALIQRAQKTHQTILNNLDDIQASLTHPESLVILDGMRKVLEDYGDNITTLVQAREQRDQLIDESMLSLADNAFRIIKELKTIAPTESNNDVVKQVYSISDHLLTAQVNAASFFSNRQYTLQKKAEKSLKQAEEAAIALSQSADSSSELKALSHEFIENILAYENVFHQTLQATRGYLSLINVVMAGQAAEFTTQSRNLKKSTLSTLKLVTESTKERLDSAQKTTYLATAIAVAIGLALAFLTSQSLSRPIRDIADTFGLLVSGNHNTAIPGLNRGDEIGQLANAANVFKARNERTEKILKETQVLSKELQLRESQLKAQTAALQKSNDELDNFAYIASHDLKSPLRAIDNLSIWLREDCGDILPGESLEHLDKMQQRIKRMEGLLADLLEYSRIGRVEVTIEKVDTAQLLDDVVQLVSKPENFIINMSDSLPEITTQVSPLKQVFLNLLTNAIKYNDKDEVSIGVTSQVLNEDFVAFSVSDNGPGIDPKFHKRIFEMFQTLQSKDVVESSGMGLAIIKKVIEGQGGEISIKSALGEGSVFTFSWPLNNTNKHEAI